MDDLIDSIPPEQAAAIIEPKLQELQAEGWKIVDETDYSARLIRGKANLDIWIDLLGNIEMQEKPMSLLQETGQIIAILLLIIIALFILVILSLLHI